LASNIFQHLPFFRCSASFLLKIFHFFFGLCLHARLRQPWLQLLLWLCFCYVQFQLLLFKLKYKKWYRRYE
jgi:putative effector of murein hydrolase